MRVFGRFLCDVVGNVAILMGILAVPLLLSIGLATDYARGVAARSIFRNSPT